MVRYRRGNPAFADYYTARKSLHLNQLREISRSSRVRFA
jgi:hypothetical protein